MRCEEWESTCRECGKPSWGAPLCASCRFALAEEFTETVAWNRGRTG